MQKLQCYNSVKRENGRRPEKVPQFVDIELLIDRSGSMRTMFKETCKGVTDFVENQKVTQKKTGSFTTLKITTFDNNAEIMEGFDAVDITTAPSVNFEYLKPRYTTRLIDTAVESLIKQKRRIRLLKQNLSPEIRKLNPNIIRIFAILTDGMDNESTLYSSEDLNKMLKNLSKEGGNAFFLGSGQDAINTGNQYGFEKGKCLTYTSEGTHANAAMRAMSNQISRACSGSDNTEFTSLQRTSSLNEYNIKNKTDPAVINKDYLKKFIRDKNVQLKRC